LPKEGRIRGALWWAEYAARTYQVEVRLAHVVTAFEAFLNTDSRLATPQFLLRFPALSRELGFDVSRTFTNELYDARSKTAHGRFTSLAKATRQARQLAKAEEILRAALKKAIEDDDFRIACETLAGIEARWGTMDPPTCP
jgi:hypothetical protein